MGEALYIERDEETWNENWELMNNNRTNYRPSVRIRKNVIDRYSSIQVEIICKIHSRINYTDIGLYREDGNSLDNVTTSVSGSDTRYGISSWGFLFRN